MRVQSRCVRAYLHVHFACTHAGKGECNVSAHIPHETEDRTRMSSSIASTCDVSSLMSFVKIANVSCVRDTRNACRRGQSPVVLLVPLVKTLACLWGHTAQVCTCGGCEWW